MALLLFPSSVRFQHHGHQHLDFRFSVTPVGGGGVTTVPGSSETNLSGCPDPFLIQGINSSFVVAGSFKFYFLLFVCWFVNSDASWYWLGSTLFVGELSHFSCRNCGGDHSPGCGRPDRGLSMAPWQVGVPINCFWCFHCWICEYLTTKYRGSVQSESYWICELQVYSLIANL